MEALVEELTDILRTFMLQPFREQGENPAEAERIRETLPQLRQARSRRWSVVSSRRRTR